MATIEYEKTPTYQLARVGAACRKAIERQMGLIGLHGGQAFVLIELWKKDGQRQIDLADKLDLKAPTINKIIKGLEREKLVTRERLADDGRSSRIFLTPKALRKRGEIDEAWVELEASHLSVLSSAQRDMLFELLGKLGNSFTGRADAAEDED